MSKHSDVWMPLYIGDYLRDTQHLSRDEHGAYLLLLMACWVRGGWLPADDRQLAAIAKATPAEWRRLKPVMTPFFTEGDPGITQGRLARELAKAKRNSDARSVNGKKGGRPKAKEKLQVSGDEPKPKPIETPSPSPSPSPTESSEAIASGAAAPMTPADLEREFWRSAKDFLGKRGIPPNKAGPMIGAWKRDFGSEAVMRALTKAQAESAEEPIPFITACLTRGSNGRKPIQQESAYQRAARLLDEREAWGDGREPDGALFPPG